MAKELVVRELVVRLTGQWHFAEKIFVHGQILFTRDFHMIKDLYVFAHSCLIKLGLTQASWFRIFLWKITGARPFRVLFKITLLKDRREK